MTEWLLSYQLADINGQHPMPIFKDLSAAVDNYSDDLIIMAKFIIYVTGLVSFRPAASPTQPISRYQVTLFPWGKSAAT